MKSFILTEDHGLLINVTPPTSVLQIPQLKPLKGFSIVNDNNVDNGIWKEDIVFINKNIYDIVDYFSAECDVCENELDFLNPESKWHMGEDYNGTYCGNCKPDICWTSSEWWQKHFGDFGSLKDWIEIYESDQGEEDNFGVVLYNINKQSKLCDTVAISCCDGHGRVGIYTFPFLTKNEIFQELESYHDKPVTTFLEKRGKYPNFG